MVLFLFTNQILLRLHPEDKKRALPYSNVLAFSEDLLPLLWKWISEKLNIPLEADFDQKNWTMDHLTQGLFGLSTIQTAVLCLFCQVERLECKNGIHVSF